MADLVKVGISSESGIIEQIIDENGHAIGDENNLGVSGQDSDNPFISPSGVMNVSDLMYLAVKEFQGKLFKEISAEFTNNAVQITHIVPNGKKFYFLSAKLYPVVDTVHGASAPALTNRRADVEIKLDGTVIDVLTYDFENRVSTTGQSQDNASQLDSRIVDSLVGDGVKVVEATSTNISGTFRVSLIGIEEDTADSPAI